MEHDFLHERRYDMRPDFKDIKTYQEFSTYYWYREELIKICKNLHLDASGTKLDLNRTIHAYFDGKKIEKKTYKKRKPTNEPLTLDSSLIECGFCFNNKFRDFFSLQTGIYPFKFNVDMVATAKKVKENNDLLFTLRDMLEVYNKNLHYAKNDSSACQWNRFYKDFCLNSKNDNCKNKLKTAAALWQEVKNSTQEKVYTSNLRLKFAEIIKKSEK